jgi:hypothetical protein
MAPPEDKVVDHKNGDTSDNRRSNLRICSKTENARNRKMNKTNSVGYKGVSKVGTRFRARIWTDEGRKHLGCFETKEEAYQAYIEASRKYHGEFACQ